MEYSPDAPIYLQIIYNLKTLIISEQWQPGQRIGSVRELALEFRVNPNTMQRALTELERGDLIRTERTTGRFVTEDKELIEKTREQMAFEIIEKMYNSLKKLGYSREQIISIINSNTI